MMNLHSSTLATPNVDRHTGSGVFYAGVVLYHPDSEHHIESIRILLSQGIVVVVFDNSEDVETKQNNRVAVSQSFGNRLQYLEDEQGNIGLSAAFNRIVNVVLQDESAKGLFLFDQDTDVNATTLQHLQESFDTLQTCGQFGLVAGYPVRDTGIPYRVRPRSSSPAPFPELVAVNAASSSFSLIPVSTLKKVGAFQEDFFIDYIDFDFCLRCWLNDLPVYIDKMAPFLHRVGLGDVLVGNKPLFPIATPFRHYYQMRNIILSGIRAKVPVITLCKQVLLKLTVTAIVGVYAGGLIQRLKFTIKGMNDGFMNHGGKL